MENHEKERDWAAFLAAQQGIPRSEVGKTPAERIRAYALSEAKRDQVFPCVNCAHREVCMHVPTVQRIKEKIDEAIKDIQGDTHVESGLNIKLAASISCPQYRIEYQGIRGDGG